MPDDLKSALLAFAADVARASARLAATLVEAPSEPAPIEPAPVEAAPTPIDPVPVDQTPVEPAPVDPAPSDPAPVDPVPTPPVIGGSIAYDAQDLVDKLRAASDGDTIGLMDGAAYGDVSIRGIHKAVTVEGAGHFSKLTIAASSGLTLKRAVAWPVTAPVVGNTKLFNITIAPDATGITLDGLTLRGRIDSDDWVNWSAADWMTWRMGAVWSRGADVVIRNCRAIGVQMGFMTAGLRNLVEDNIVFGFSDDGARLCEDFSIARRNRITDRVKINEDHPDGFQCFKVGAPLVGVVVEANTIIERTQNIAADLRTHLQAIGLHNGPYLNPVIRGNTIRVSSPLGIAANQGEGLVIDGNDLRHVDNTPCKYPVIRVTNPIGAYTLTNNIAPTYVLPEGSVIYPKQMSGNGNTTTVYP